MRVLLLLAAGLAVAAPASGQERDRAANTPTARAALADFARCVVRRSPEKAHSALTRDFTTAGYLRTLRALSDLNRDCLRIKDTMRADGLPFAAAMAEELLRQNATPLNVRLIRAAGTEPPTYSPGDRVAMCIVRSDPDNVAALVGSSIASPAEDKAARSLELAMDRCSPPGVSLDVDAYGLRSILATASYRLLSKAGGEAAE